MSGPVFLVIRVLLALALYAFLGWALWTLWQDLRRQSSQVTARQAPPITLVFEKEGEKRSIRFTTPVVLIGRDPASDCYLEDQTISAHHTRLSYHHGHWWVEDLRSTNGTYLNLEPVTEPLVLTSGDQLRCGQVGFQIILNDNEPSAEESSLPTS
ncbi:MAG: FHA domain-containing protein [Chloroflexi bacterium]|jgi:pSer/pThr/pTyr-binding forkhead associated (FHA) protein|nr:FHA domain-containing protein [Chloroflexota bacterium]